MRTAKLAKFRPLVFVALAVCVAFLIIVALASGYKFTRFGRQAQETDLRITSKASAVGIITVNRIGEDANSDVQVTLLNQSNKRILAYTFALGQDEITTFSISLAPGQTTIERIPLANVEAAAKENPTKADVVRLSAVYFEGGTTEGEPEQVARLSSRMLGIKEQAKLALQILRQAYDSSESDSERMVQAVEFQVSTLATSGNHFARSSEAAGGKSFINSKVMRDMKEIRKLPALDQRRRLADLIWSYERLEKEL